MAVTDVLLSNTEERKSQQRDVLSIFDFRRGTWEKGALGYEYSSTKQQVSSLTSTSMCIYRKLMTHEQ